MQTRLISPQGSFQLLRFPHYRNETLQAWDAADEYLLNYLAAENLPAAGSCVCILNDGCGALATALHGWRPTAISDSYLSQQASRENLLLNGLPADSVRLLDSLSTPAAGIDLLLVRIPKTLALLEDQLLRVRPRLNPGCRIVAAGMVKHLPASAWQLLARLLGPTVPAQAVKKARLLLVALDPDLRPPSSPYPVTYRLDTDGGEVVNHANVFSRDGLDIGTRFFLQHLPAVAAGHCIDLGCGNGLLGVTLAARAPAAQLSFVDESYMAVASARENFRRRCGAARQAEFVVGDCLSGFAAHSADCILCNPPFHQQHAVGDRIAWRMFRDAHRVLRAGGELRVIGNRHLHYDIHLKTLFGNVAKLAANAKFEVFSAVRR